MKNILIIGASSGVGRALKDKLNKKGYSVYSTYLNHPTEDGEYLDVRESELDFSYLPETLDGLVYCPGSINLKPFHRIKPIEFLEDFELHVLGAVKVIQNVLSRLKKSKQASIVLYSTVAVQNGFTYHASVASSKGAIEGLARSLAAEYAPAIRVNCIAPSIINTPLAERFLNSDKKVKANADRHPLRRIGQPEDVANLTQFLLDQQSSWITGQVIALDGGIGQIKK